MKFPCFVYKTPGPYLCRGIYRSSGKTYQYKTAESKEEFHALFIEGWFPTLAEALNPSSFDPVAYGLVDEDEEGTGEHPPENPENPFAFNKALNDDSEKEEETETSIKEKNLPLTREELEAKAKELGIKFAPNTKDTTLLKKITDTLGV